jgi:hypothetical protein
MNADARLLRVTIQIVGKEKRVFEAEVSRHPWTIFREVVDKVKTLMGPSAREVTKP